MNRQWAALFLAIGLGGCHKRLNFGPFGEITEANELLRLLATQEASVVSLEGEGRVKLQSPAQSGSLGLFIAVHRPSLLRLEALDFFGRPQAVLVTDGQRFSLFAAQEGKFYRGPASSTNMARLLPVAMPPKELVAVMLGQAPRILTSSAALSVDRRELAYLLALSEGAVTQLLRVHPSYHRVMRSRVLGAPLYGLDFDEFRESHGVVFPAKIVLSSEASATRVELTYKDVRVNGPLDLTLYELAPPPNVVQVELDEQGNETAVRPPTP